MRSRTRSRRSRGFTLVELLIVITIILVVSAATIPAIMPALNQRRVSEAARILQASLVGAHDAAIHANAPRGIRLLPDPALPAGTLGANRLIPIEPAPAYSEGKVSIFSAQSVPLSTTMVPTANWPDPLTSAAPIGYLIVWQAQFDTLDNSGILNSPTSWYWNVRVGEKLRFKDSGRTYTIIGPQTIPYGVNNPEGFVNIGVPGKTPPLDPASGTTNPEFLYVVNGVDDDGDGFIDESWDGVDNDLNNLIDIVNDPGNANEFETEVWLGSQATVGVFNSAYMITRRPTPSQNTREVMLPAGTVIDLTSANASRERSRLPVDPNSGYVDIMIQPNGQVVPTTLFAAPTSMRIADAFFHFWITDRNDVHEPVSTTAPFLPFPAGTSGYSGPTFLTGERRLVTLFARTGNILTNSIENFNVNDVNAPFYDAQAGYREAK